ncbi:hypothetical protein D3C87_1556000 [compost metagenome]
MAVIVASVFGRPSARPGVALLRLMRLFEFPMSPLAVLPLARSVRDQRNIDASFCLNFAPAAVVGLKEVSR